MLKENAKKLALLIQSALQADVLELINDSYPELDESGNQVTIEEDSFYIAKAKHDHEDILVLNKLLIDEGFAQETESSAMLKEFGICDNTR